MKQETLKQAIAEAERFIERAKMYAFLEKEQAEIKASKKPGDKDFYWYKTFPKESGAVRRSSMDLSRVLADLRAGR